MASTLKSVRNRALDLLGLQIKRQPPGQEWRGRDYFVRSSARRIRGIPDDRCFVLQNVIRSLSDVPGDVAECGVRLGKSTAFLGEADPAPRTYHLFDSFEGLSAPTDEDRVAETGEPYWEKGDIFAAEDVARANLAHLNNLVFHRGWIPDRFPEVADRTFALLHVDVDLYRPTLDALAFFWPRLAPGGMVVCDDYGSKKCPGAKRALDEFFADGRGRLMELPTQQGLAFKPG